MSESRRRAVALSSATSLTLAALLGLGENARANPSVDAVRLTVVGDSLALGVGATDSSRGFAFDLFRRVRMTRPASEVTNLAIGGATTADVVRLELGRVASTKPDVVLIEAGANDLVRRHATKAFARDFERLVGGVRRASPQARVVLFNVPDISVSPIFEASAKSALHRLAVAYNGSVTAVARRAGVPVVDLFGFSQRARTDPAQYLSTDQFHPSDAGHAAIAAAAWPSVRDAIARFALRGQPLSKNFR